MRNQILHGDVLEMGRTLDSGSVNCIVTSPPYYGLRDYGLPPTNWPELAYAPMAGLPPLAIPSMWCCLGLEKTIEAYVGHLVLVFRELWRVLRDDGTAWLNLGDSYANSPKGSIVVDNSTLSGSKTYQDNGTPPKLLDKSKLGVKPKNLLGIPWRVAFALQADGWYLRSDIVWAKPNPMPESVEDRPAKSHEYIFLLTKRAKYWYDQDAIKEEVTSPHAPAWSTKRPTEEGPMMRKKGDGTSASQWDEPERIWGNPQGRNKRTVWTVATKPYKGAHFACFPPKLIEPCILAGCPGQVCVECGEPWVRVVEQSEAYKTGGGNTNSSANGPMDRNGKGQWDKGAIITNRNSKTLHFTPICQCCPLPANKEASQPGIVLDPFFGSGTTAQVAEQTGRDWLGIDLNTDYIKLAEARVSRTQPALFAR